MGPAPARLGLTFQKTQKGGGRPFGESVLLWARLIPLFSTCCLFKGLRGFGSPGSFSALRQPPPGAFPYPAALSKPLHRFFAAKAAPLPYPGATTILPQYLAKAPNC